MSQNIDWTTFLDIIYPVGSYYETSNTSFNPNTAWGGTWVEDTSGRVLVSKTSSGALSTVGSTGGSTTHAHDFKVGMTGYYGTMIDGEQDDFGYWGAWSYSQNKYAKSYGFEANHTSHRNAALQTGIVTGSDAARYTVGDTTSESSYQPYLVVKRWHRTA